MKSEITFDLKQGAKALFKAVKDDMSNHEPRYTDHGLVSFADLGLLGQCR